MQSNNCSKNLQTVLGVARSLAMGKGRGAHTAYAKVEVLSVRGTSIPYIWASEGGVLEPIRYTFIRLPSTFVLLKLVQTHSRTAG